VFAGNLFKDVNHAPDVILKGESFSKCSLAKPFIENNWLLRMRELGRMLRMRKWTVRKNGNTRGTLINMFGIKSQGKAIAVGIEEMGANLTPPAAIQVKGPVVSAVRLVI